MSQGERLQGYKCYTFSLESLLKWPRPYIWQGNRQKVALSRSDNLIACQNPITHEGERNILKLGTCGEPNFHEVAWKWSLSNWQCQKKPLSPGPFTDFIVTKTSFPERPRTPTMETDTAALPISLQNYCFPRSSTKSIDTKINLH